MERLGEGERRSLGFRILSGSALAALIAAVIITPVVTMIHHDDGAQGSSSSAFRPASGSHAGSTSTTATAPTPSAAPGTSLSTAPSAAPGTPPSTATTDPAPTANSAPTSVVEELHLNVDDPAGLAVVVNKTRPIHPKKWKPANLDHVGAVAVREDVAGPLRKLIKASVKEGYPVYAHSGYRSYQDQRSTFNSWVRQLGKAKALESSAKPGFSEHQTGLAVDMMSADGHCNNFSCFTTSDQAQWLAKNVHRFGFVIRFEAGQTDVTGYESEPWHIRYIGKDLAARYEAEGWHSLEAFFSLPPAPDYLQ
ncbi:MAG: M15 family metallopeptidase [Cellulomonadaceae bacterium]|jgi:D-alanyl-D-alanine carboxypeptidase|nr:M15 family metallopeptidase [Cellulomonadaceae bacterium]